MRRWNNEVVTHMHVCTFTVLKYFNMSIYGAILFYPVFCFLFSHYFLILAFQYPCKSSWGSVSFHLLLRTVQYVQYASIFIIHESSQSRASEREFSFPLSYLHEGVSQFFIDDTIDRAPRGLITILSELLCFPCCRQACSRNTIITTKAKQTPTTTRRD